MKTIRNLKKKLFFLFAAYFKFFAQIKLSLWKPRIILVTGSSGKTTLLDLLESQIGEEAKYSHKANSAFGIPFDILGLKRKRFSWEEWFFLFILAPYKAFRVSSKKRWYIVEADCDRPGEGKFLGSLLKPEIVLWLNVSRTHSFNFDFLVKKGKFITVEEAIANEFGYFIEYCTKLAVVNIDSPLIKAQLLRTKAKIETVEEKGNLLNYQISTEGTIFKIKNEKYFFKYLLPKDSFYAIIMSKITTEYLGIKFDPSFPKFVLSPGRSSLFRGIKKTLLIDSTYNANFDSMRAILSMFQEINSEKKWAIIGDMIEQGREEPQEHQRLAETLSAMNLEKIILIGPRVIKHTLPLLKNKTSKDCTIESFLTPKEVLNFLQENLKGGETILFKGAGFLEGVIEALLADKKQSVNLCRREFIWERRRKIRGL